MEFLNQFISLFSNVTEVTWQGVVMWIIGGVLIYLAIKRIWSPRSCFRWVLAQSL